MSYIISVPMGKKNEFIRIRSDDALKAALAESAKRHIRQESDEARFLLMKSLGLLKEEDAPLHIDPNH